MRDENQIASTEFDVNQHIDAQVEKILENKKFSLPGTAHPLVGDYVRKIEGTYDVVRSKEDTDNAIDLLYIAYNTTPQDEGAIRSSIDNLMSRLIELQGKSAAQMSSAVVDAGVILKSIRGLFGDWENVRDGEGRQELKDFIGSDLIDLAEDIKKRAERISGGLTRIANSYDEVIKDTTKATHQGEEALAARLKNQDEVKKEIAKNKAEREKLDSLVSDLQADIAKYEKMANDYKAQAETAENRAFIMSIVRVGAQMIASTVPAITAGITGAATGGVSLLAASAASTLRQTTNAAAATTEDDKTADILKAKTEIAEKAAEKAAAEREKNELESKAKELVAEKAKIKDGSDAEIKAAQIAAIDKRIEDNEKAIKDKESKIATATAALNALKDSLKVLDENMGKMAEKQEKQGADLRSLQMKMLEKIEAYENTKREQNAELVKINALLVGQHTVEETIQLAVKSLNLSLKALKRMREIIIEIAFFFKTFAAFMDQVMENSDNESEMIKNVVGRDNVTSSLMQRIKRNTNDFFVTQVAEWQAAEIVSAKFVGNFKDGWSKLNKLSGTYLTGDELKAYLVVAATQIDAIAFKRKQAAAARLVELEIYRARISAEV